MKRVLIFSTAYAPFVGGAEIAIKEITERLSSEYEFDLITARLRRGLPLRERVGSVQVYRVGIGVPLFDKLAAPFIGALLALYLNFKHPYDLYWVVMVSFAGGAAYIANILKFWNPVPIVLTLQEGDSEEHLTRRWWGLIDFSWRRALSASRSVTVLSTYLKDRARRYGFKGNIVLVPNGVDVERFSPEGFPDERSSVRAAWGLSDDQHILITTSRLVTKNAVADVIAALPHLPPDVVFVVVGSGPHELALKVLTSELDLTSRVLFLGEVKNEGLPKLLRAADIFVRPSLSEGQGISFLEAMAVGLPVIATQEGGIADFLFDGKRNPDRSTTGWAVEKNSPEQIASAVSDILAHPQEVETVTKAARAMVAEKYDWDLIATDMRTKVFEPIVNT